MVVFLSRPRKSFQLWMMKFTIIIDKNTYMYMIVYFVKKRYDKKFSEIKSKHKLTWIKLSYINQIYIQKLRRKRSFLVISIYLSKGKKKKVK